MKPGSVKPPSATATGLPAWAETPGPGAATGATLVTAAFVTLLAESPYLSVTVSVTA